MNPIAILSSQIDAHNLWDKEVTLKRNEFLKVKGSLDTSLYKVNEGSLKIFVVDEGDEQIIRFGYKDSIIAALDSFLTGKSSELCIQALKKSRLQRIRKPTLMNLIMSSKENMTLWISILESFTLQQMERERDILTSSPTERFRRVLERSPLLFQEIPHKHIASYLRMTPETLSRIKKS